MIPKVAARLAVAALAAAAGLGCLAPNASASTVTPSGIDSTGTHDDTSALQSLIDSLPDDSTLVFPAGAEYRIEGTLHVKNKNHLTIEGNGALFFATTTGDRTRSQWSFEAGSNIVVRDVVVKGANPNAGTSSAAYVVSLEAQHAFNIFSTNGIELDHVAATDTYGDFVYIGLQAGGFAKNVYIHDSTFERNGRQGISVTGADGVRIVRNTLADTRRATFDLEPNGSSWGVFNVDIEDNVIGAGRLNVLSSAGIGPESNIVFAHNTINRPFNMQVGDTQNGRRGPFTINGNVATQTWGSAAGSGALNFSNIDGLIVTGNTIPLQAGRGDYGVKAMTSCGVDVTGNTITNAVADAYVTPATTCTTTTTVAVPTTPTVPSPAPTPTTASTSGPPPAPLPLRSVGTSTGGGAPTGSPSPEPSSSAPTAQQTTPSPLQVTPRASASTEVLAATGGTSPKPSPATAHGHAATPPASASQHIDGATYITAADTAPTTHLPRLLSTRVMAATVAALTVLLLLGTRLFGRPTRKARTARRRLAPTPMPRLATDVLPQRFAR